MSIDFDVIAKFATPVLRMLIFGFFFSVFMQLQLLQRTLHMGALLFICFTNGYVLLDRCADF